MGKTWCLPLIVTVLVLHHYSCSGRELHSLGSASTDYLTDLQLHNSKPTAEQRSTLLNYAETALDNGDTRLKIVRDRMKEFAGLQEKVHKKENEGFGMDEDNRQEALSKYAILETTLRWDLAKEKGYEQLPKGRLPKTEEDKINAVISGTNSQDIALKEKELSRRVEEAKMEKREVKKNLEDALKVEIPIVEPNPKMILKERLKNMRDILVVAKSVDETETGFVKDFHERLVELTKEKNQVPAGTTVEDHVRWLFILQEVHDNVLQRKVLKILEGYNTDGGSAEELSLTAKIKDRIKRMHELEGEQEALKTSIKAAMGVKELISTEKKKLYI